MRDDLLEAQAYVDWAIAQLDPLKRRLIAWREEPPYRIVVELHPKMGKKRLYVRDVKFPPAIINAEVGAIINSLRSSLDVLVNILAKRNGHIDPKDAYFPISRSRDDFFIGKHAGRKAIKRLSGPDQAIIESLEPWRGGNNSMLIILHDLDLTRKHRRLLTVSINPLQIRMPTAQRGGTKFRSMWGPFQDDAVVAWTDAYTDHSQIDIALEVTFAKGEPLAGVHVVEALDQLARFSHSIIKLFDTP